MPLIGISLFMCLALLRRQSHAFTPSAVSSSRGRIFKSPNVKMKVKTLSLGSASATRTSSSRQQVLLQMSIAYDSLMEKIPSPTVIKAVEDSPNGKVVASGKLACADAIHGASMTEGTLAPFDG